MEETPSLSALLQTANSHFDQRDFDQARDACDRVLENAPRGSDEWAEARELRRHTVEFDMLGHIAAAVKANNFQEAIPLLESATAEKKLKFDLDRQPLEGLLDTMRRQRSAEADKKANSFVDQALGLIDENNYVAAGRKYKDALAVKFISDAFTTQIHAGQVRLNDIIRRQQQFDRLLQQAHSAQAAGRFSDALADSNKAIGVFPEQPEAAEALKNQLEEQLKNYTEIQKLLEQAAEKGAKQRYGQVVEILSSAQEVAAKLAYAPLASDLAERLVEARKRLSSVTARADGLLASIKDALTGKHWGAAAQQLEELRQVAPEAPGIDELEAQLAQAKVFQDRASLLKQQASGLKNPHDRMEKYREALRLTPDDEDLQQAFEKASQDLAAEAMEATAAELDLGFDTPGEVDRGKFHQGKLIVPGVAQLVEELGEIRGYELADVYRIIFARIAARKLREFIAQNAVPLVKRGQFAEALKYFTQAEDEWSASWLKNNTIHWTTDKTIVQGGKEEKLIFTEPYENKALIERLKIVAHRRQFVVIARDVYPSIEQAISQAAEARSAGDLEKAIPRYESALHEIDSQDIEVRGVFSGVRENVQRSLFSSLLLHSQEVERRYNQERRIAEMERDLSRLDEALLHADAARQAGKRLKELGLRFMEIAREEQKPSWKIALAEDEVEGLYSQIDRYRRYLKAMQEAQSSMELGEYSDAEARFRTVGEASPWWEEAQARLSRLPFLVERKRDYEGAVSKNDYEAAAASLIEIISHDGRSSWAKNQLNELQPDLQKRRSAVRLAGLGKVAFDTGNFTLALDHLSAALVSDPNLEMAQGLLKEAQQKVDAQQEIGRVRQEMIAAYNRGRAKEDFEEAKDKAQVVLENAAQDAGALRIKQNADQVLKLIHRLEVLRLKEKWDEALLELKRTPYHNNYLSDLGAEFNRSLLEKVGYQELIEQANAAKLSSDYRGALIKSSSAIRKYPAENDPVNLAREMRARLTQSVKTRIALGRDVEESELAEAEQDYEALSRASRILQDIPADLPPQQQEMVRIFARETEAARESVCADIDRAQRIVKARRYLKSSEPARAFEELQPIAGIHTADLEMQKLWDESSFYHQRLQALEIMKTIPVDWQKTAEAFQKALDLIAVYPPGEAHREELLAHYREANLEAGLLACDQALREGRPVTEIRSTLRGLPDSDARVGKRHRLLGELDAQLSTAEEMRASGYYHEALAALDKALNLQKGYKIGEEKKAQVLNELLAKADSVVAETRTVKDFGLARQLYHLAKEHGRDDARARGIEGENDVEKTEERIFRELKNEIHFALDNPDLTEGERFALEEKIQSTIAMDVEWEKVTIAQSLEDVKNRSLPIREVERFIANARTEMEKVRAAETYEDAGRHLEQVKNALDRATQFDDYRGRSTLRQLWETYNRFNRQRNETNTRTQEYRSARSELRRASPQLVHPDTVSENQIAQTHREGKNLIDQVLELNKKLRELDPLNQFKLRPNWVGVGSGQDPLNEEMQYYEGQLLAINTLSTALIATIKRIEQANDFALRASETIKEANSDAGFREAIEAWEKAADAYHSAAQTAQPGQNLELADPAPHVYSLYGLCVPLVKKCENAEAAVNRLKNQAAEKLERITNLRMSGESNFIDSEHNVKAIQTAQGYFQEILSENPRDTMASLRLAELQRRLRSWQARQRNLMIAAAVAGIVIIVLALAAFFSRQGGLLNPLPPTPTPTLIPTRTTAPTITPTAAWTETPVPTPLPSLTTAPTALPTLEPTPWICPVKVRSPVYEKPSDRSHQIFYVTEQDGFQIVDKIIPQDSPNPWYKVIAADGREGYIPEYYFQDCLK